MVKVEKKRKGEQEFGCQSIILTSKNMSEYCEVLGCRRCPAVYLREDGES